MRAVGAAIGAVLVALVATMLVELVVVLVGRVVPDAMPLWPLARVGVFGGHPLWPWAISAVPAAALVAARLLIWPAPLRSRAVRAVVAAAGIAALAVVALTAIGWREMPPGLFDGPLEAAVVVVGALACLAIASGRLAPASGASRGLRYRLAIAAIVAVVALGLPTLAGAWADREAPAMQCDHVELVAAYPYEPEQTHAVVIDTSGGVGDVVTYDGHRYNLQRSDRVAITRGDVGGVRWFDAPPGAYVVVRLRGDARAAVRRRSLRRISQYDALFVDGRLDGIFLYDDVMNGRFFVHDGDRARAAALYRELTGAAPP
ncbi:MAG TPA: hypothetical protein VGG74_11135 [Kofleriaceae bacterium]